MKYQYSTLYKNMEEKLKKKPLKQMKILPLRKGNSGLEGRK